MTKQFKLFTGNNYGVQKVDGEVIFDSIISMAEADVLVDLLNDLSEENEQLKSENKRLTDKLNKTALELVDECISQGKATEISEMSYREFLDYRAENGKPMELHL